MNNFQTATRKWIIDCFGEEIANNKAERSHRFLEEALELGQACGVTSEEAHMLVDYVFGRPVGEKLQEVGGVLITLAALCSAQGLSMEDAGNLALMEGYLKMDKIRAKRASKPAVGPLPTRTEQ